MNNSHHHHQQQPAKVIASTPWQTKLLSLPEVDIFALGGRGAGKTFWILLEILRRLELYPGCRTLMIRQSLLALQEVRFQLFELLSLMFGGKQHVRHDAAAGYFLLPCGSVIQLGHLQQRSDLLKFQGQSFDLICLDELGSIPSLELYDILLGSLRTTGPAPCRVLAAGNPGGCSNNAVRRRWIDKRTSYALEIDEPSNRPFFWAPCTSQENPLLPASYIRQMQGIAKSNPGLYASWVSGDFSSIDGMYFGGAWSERNIFPAYDRLPARLHRAAMKRGPVCLDWGVSAPAWAGICMNVGPSPFELTPGRVIGANSYVVVAETHTSSLDNTNVGDGTSAQDFAAQVRQLCDRLGVQARGVADAACFARSHAGGDAASVGDLFRQSRLYLKAGPKGARRGRYEFLRELIANAGDPSRPGLYVASSCEYLIETLPTLARSTRDPTATDPRGHDHAVDGLSYHVGHGKGHGARLYQG